METQFLEHNFAHGALHREQNYKPEVDDHGISVDDFVPDMLNDNLGDFLDLLKVSKHIKTQVTNVVLECIGVEGDLDQFNVHLWRVILAKRQAETVFMSNIHF